MGATKSSRARKKTFESLKMEIIKNGLDVPMYMDYVDEYMIYYDSLQKLNEWLLGTTDIKTYNDILKEKRQVTKEMRNILTFLKLKPTDEGGGGFEGNELEDL